MEFSVMKEDVQMLLGRASGTVSNKDVNPILKNFMLKVGEGKLKVMATDMSLGAVADAAIGTIIKDGITAVPARKLMEFIDAIPAKHQLLFRLEGQVLTIYVNYKKEVEKETYRSKTVLHCMDPDVYPEFPEFVDDKSLEVDLKLFLEGVSTISFATADTELKANLMAVYINSGVMYSADGHRACRWEVPECKLIDLMIPNSAVHLLVKLLRDSAASVMKVYQTQYHILFKIGSEIYHCRKIESQFPDLEKRVFSKIVDYKFKLTFPRDRMREAIKCARVTSDETSVMMMTYIDEGMGGKLVISSKDNVEDSFEEHIPGCEWNGGSFVRSVNFNYLEDVLSVMDAGIKVVDMVMGEDKGNRQSMFSFKEGKLSTIIMPQRVSSDKKDAVHKRVQKHTDASEAKENMGASTLSAPDAA